MGKKTTKTEEKQHAVTQPNVPDWLAGPHKDYMSRIQQYMGADPMSFVAGPGDIQRQAFGLTGGLFNRLNKRFGMPPQPQEVRQPSPQVTIPQAAPVQAPAPVHQPMPQTIDYAQYAQTDPRVAAQMQALQGNMGQGYNGGALPPGLFDWMK